MGSRQSRTATRSSIAWRLHAKLPPWQRTRGSWAAEAARKAALDLEPVSVFISRKSQRLYVRQAFQPILESPVAIRDADRPIGNACLHRH